MPPPGTCNSGTENVAEIAEETFPDDEDDNEYNEEAEAEMVEEELGNVIEKSKEHLLLNELLHSLLDRKN